MKALCTKTRDDKLKVTIRLTHQETERIEMEIMYCQRCGAECVINPPKESNAKMLKRAKGGGLCVNCAVHDWLRNTYPVNILLAQSGPKALQFEHIRQQFADIMKSQKADAEFGEIDWDAIIKNWELPFPNKVKPSNTNPYRKTTINKIICGDCLQILPTLPKVKMVFADPPDNLGLQYDGYKDKLDSNEYLDWLETVCAEWFKYGEIFWLSINPVWLKYAITWWNWRIFIWRFTFGQHNSHDCGQGFRPLLRIMGTETKIYPDAIREPSARQTLYHDKRANPLGRVPDDVWDFSRVCGTFKERREWHPTQHPEALIERIVKFSTIEGDLVIDMFAGTGTVNRVCKRLNRNCIGIEISRHYCEKIAEELGLKEIKTGLFE